MNPPSFHHQRRILSARYMTSMLGDMGTVALLILQAPFIGWLCTLVWGSVETDTETLYFVLSLSAVWFGCINACREIVKERAIVERERLLGLSMGAYVLSRFQVLAVIGFIQVLLLHLAVNWQLDLRGSFMIQCLALWMATLSGIGLGLLVSALATTQERAVGAVPLLILPQILFSEFMVQREYFTDVVLVVEKAMPVRWGYEIFRQLAEVCSSGLSPHGRAVCPTEWSQVALSFLVLGIISLLLGTAARIALIPQREVL